LAAVPSLWTESSTYDRTLLDRRGNSRENTTMKTQEDPLSTEAADEQAVFEHAFRGKPLDPEVRRRVRERAEKISEELRRKHGEMNIAVDLIRETRDEE
jgi:hypothetical protein